MSDTDHTPPELATEEWLMSARQQKADETMRNYRRFRNRWLEFCEERGIESMDDVTGKTFMEFKICEMAVLVTSTATVRS